jgi:MOSC domain-containing protein YiiM
LSDPILRSIQVGRPAEHGTEGAEDPMDSAWTSGFYKNPVDGPILLGRTNLEGAGQADLVNHGGPDKQ